MHLMKDILRLDTLDKKPKVYNLLIPAAVAVTVLALIVSYSGEKVYQILAFVPEHHKKLLDDLLDECHVTSWNDTGIDIIPEGGGKSVGIQKFLDRYGIDRSETMAFGDGENDIDMLRFAGIGVAMGKRQKTRQIMLLTL